MVARRILLRKAVPTILLIVICFVVNVPVAWLCSRYSIHYAVSTPSDQEEEDIWRAYAPPDWEFTRREHPINAIESGTGITLTRIFCLDEQGQQFREVAEVRCGWPFRCLKGGYSLLPDGSDPVPVGAWFWTTVVPNAISLTGPPAPRMGHFPLPQYPIVGGLIGNACVYLAITIGLTRLLVLIRTTHRESRGKCPKCGYHLRRVLASAASKPPQPDARSAGGNAEIGQRNRLASGSISMVVAVWVACRW
jgi:hypothetical protein